MLGNFDFYYITTHFPKNRNFVVVIIIIIIMSVREHRFPWLSLTICLYRPLHSAGPLDYIMYQYRAVVYKFQLVLQHLLVYGKEYSGKHHLWARPYVPSSVSHVLFVWLEGF